MSEPATATAAPSVAVTPLPPITRPQVEALLADVFKLMEYPAKLDFKDMPDGSLGVAVHFEGAELPGITPGKRSYLVDSVQFWLNKVVNRPNVPRRWVNLGVNGFPEPRAPQQQQPQQQPQQQTQQPQAAEAKPSPAPEAKGAKKPDEKRHDDKKQHERGRRDGQPDERSLKPAPDPRITAVAKSLAEKSAKLGRVYAVMGLTGEQRALMLQAGDEVKGQKTKAEGEGHWRRLVFVPDKLTPISKKQVMPDYDDEDDGGDEGE